MRDINSEEIRAICTGVRGTVLPGAPVQIKGYSLYYDYRYNRVFAAAVLVRESVKQIKTVYVSVKSYDDAGDLAGVTENVPVAFSTDDPDGTVCSDNEIILDHLNTSKAVISVIKVVFTDGEVWRRPENAEEIPVKPEEIPTEIETPEVPAIEETPDVTEDDEVETESPDIRPIETANKATESESPAKRSSTDESKNNTVSGAQKGSKPKQTAGAQKSGNISQTGKGKTPAKGKNKSSGKKKAKKKDDGNTAAWTIAIIMLSAAILTVLIATLITTLSKGGNTNTGSASSKYEQAAKYYEDGQYTSAVNLYRGLGDYLDSAQKAAEISIYLTGIPDAVFMSSSQFPCYSIDDYGVLSFDSTHYNFPSGVATLPDVFDDKPVRSLENGVFSNCSWLVEVTIPSNITVIPQKAFYLCTALKTVRLNDNVVKIGNEAFFGCSAFETLELPDSLREFGYGVFQNCGSLRELTLPAGITEIGAHDFEDCKSLEKITLNGKVTKIDNYGFCGCLSLKEIALTSKLTYVGYKAFAYCAKLEAVYYDGTAGQWAEIGIESENSALTGANIVFK